MTLAEVELWRMFHDWHGCFPIQNHFPCCNILVTLLQIHKERKTGSWTIKYLQSPLTSDTIYILAGMRNQEKLRERERGGDANSRCSDGKQQENYFSYSWLGEYRDGQEGGTKWIWALMSGHLVSKQTPPLTSCVNLDTFLDLSVPQLSLL